MTKASNIADFAAIDEAFGQVIQGIRRERGLSQERLGFESGLHRTYVSPLERGKRSPTLPSLLQVAAALRISPSEIVRRVELRIGWPAFNSTMPG